MRLASLEAVELPAAVAQEAGVRWGLPEQLVSIGVLLVLVAVACGAYFHAKLPRRPSGDNVAPVESLVMWDSFRAGIASDPQDRSAEIYGLIERDYWRRMGIVGTLAALGLSGIAGGLLVGRARSRKPPASGNRVA